MNSYTLSQIMVLILSQIIAHGDFVFPDDKTIVDAFRQSLDEGEFE